MSLMLIEACVSRIWQKKGLSISNSMTVDFAWLYKNIIKATNYKSYFYIFVFVSIAHLINIFVISKKKN